MTSQLLVTITCGEPETCLDSRPGVPAKRRSLQGKDGLRADLLRAPEQGLVDRVLLLLGTCFGADGRQLDPLGAAMRWQTTGRDLLHWLWGNYLLLAVERSGALILYRDPAGGLPCYWLRTSRGQVIAASAPDLVLAEAGLRAQLDMEDLPARLLYPDLSSGRTSLAGVKELLPGCALSIRPDGRTSVEPVWDPSRFARNAANQGSEDVETRLRALILASVKAAVADAERPLLQLSGGLDSSVVAAALHRVGPPCGAITFATRTDEGDERRFARSVAAHLGIPLAERWAEPERVDPSRAQASGLPFPTRRLFAQDLDAQVQAAARADRRDIILTGGGGDGLFGYIEPGLPTADRLRSLNLAGAWRTAADEARVHREAVWPVLGAAAAALYGAPAWARDPTFLTDAAQSVQRPLHPWVEGSRGLPPGKRAHIAALALIQPYLDTFRQSEVPVRAPLMAKPLMEFCLAIPAWSWVAGGRNRAPVRAAFRQQLPATVIRRRGKASYDRFVIEIVRRNVTLLREMLLDGLLAQAHILDRTSLEAWFRGGRETLAPRILGLVEAEAWTRHWLGMSASDDPARKLRHRA